MSESFANVQFGLIVPRFSCLSLKSCAPVTTTVKKYCDSGFNTKNKCVDIELCVDIQLLLPNPP